MAYIWIDFRRTADANQTLRRAIRELDDLDDGLQMIQRSLPPDVQSRYDISAKLKNCRKASEALEKQAKKLLDVVETGARRYQQVERRLMQEALNKTEGA